MYSVKAYRFRLKVLLILAGLALACVVGRLVQLQLANEAFYKGEAAKRRIRTSKTEPSRGIIYECTGQVLAREQPSFNLAIPYKTMVNIDQKTGEVRINEGPWVESVMGLAHLTRQQVMDRALEIVKHVERIRELEVERFIKRRQQPPPRTHRIREELLAHMIVEDVPFETVALAETDLQTCQDIQVVTSSRRQYPLGPTAAHILGHTGPVTPEEVERYGDFYDGSPYKAYQESDYVGRMGIEEQYNNLLRGARGEVIEEITDTRSNRQKLLEKPAIQGANLYLTIDKDVQLAAENALGTQVGAFVVMKPENGALLAMASYPRFDPNTFGQDFPKLSVDPRSPLVHRAIQEHVPPGSLFKLVTAVAGIETHAFTPETRFSCAGEIVLGNIHFHCWHEAGHGALDLEEGIMKSCDCYFYRAGQAAGGRALVQWAGLLGLGHPTGIDLPGEFEGNVVLPRRGALGDVFNMSIGQGKLLTTPLQMARMYAVAANGGWLVRPHVLLKVTDHNGVPIQPERPDEAYRDGKVPIAPEHLRLLRSAFRKVVTEGTVSYTKEKDFLVETGVAGKTGTAQTANKEVNHGWFAGYVPYDDPKLVFAILAEKVPGHGGETCAPFLQAFMEEYTKIVDRRKLARAGN